MTDKNDIIIIGAGLSGLSAAYYLQQKLPDLTVKVLEASDAVGGRVRTDKVDGFLLDRGFQVFLTAYPAAQRLLDYKALNLKSFKSGALVRKDDMFHRVVDPWRDPLGGLQTLFAPVGNFNDKMTVAQLKAKLKKLSLDEIFQFEDETTRSFLRSFGFSEEMIHDFFTPFFSGVFLEKELGTSSRMFRFLFKMFSEGQSVLPAYGMQEIPEQIAAMLAPGTVTLNTPVTEINGQTLTLSSGRKMSADIIVVATNAFHASLLLPGQISPPKFKAVSNAYFKAKKAPVNEPILMLSTDEHGLINTVSVPSLVSSEYAPAGQHLINVSCLGEMTQDWGAQLIKELQNWFGNQVNDWEMIKTYEIKRALPNMSVNHSPDGFQVIHAGLYRCGDDIQTASINGAIRSGKRLAQDIQNKKTIVLAS